MTLLTLDIICRDDRDVMLIEDVALLSYDFNYGWISLILRIFHFYLWTRYSLLISRIYSVFH